MTPGAEQIREAVRLVPDFPRPGILFRDLSPVLGQAPLFRRTIDLLAGECAGLNPRKIVVLDARGFLFGSALAYRLGAGVALVRKKGKLPCRSVSHAYRLEYGDAEFEMHCDSILPGEQVVIVDDVLATGGTASAALHLVERLGGRVRAALFVIELEALGGRRLLGEIPVRSLVCYRD